MRAVFRSSIALSLCAGLTACVESAPADQVATDEAALSDEAAATAAAPTAAAPTAPAATATAALPQGCPAASWCPAPSSDSTRDLLRTALHLDLTTHEASADILFVPSLTSTGASFDVHGLNVHSVRGPLGAVQYRIDNGRLDIGVPLGTVAVTVDYSFATQHNFDGWLDEGMTFLWPYFCGNLFPCKSDTTDGQLYAMDVTGVPDGKVAVYPKEIPWNAPSYQPAIAVGDYTKKDLGTSDGGTHLSVWYLPGGEADATLGSSALVKGFSFYENTYGPYVFGHEAGTVAAAWGPGAVGGMEHHPFWHVATSSMRSRLTQLHEAAHGWYGDGVRIACWEDFVLSEGLADYLSARAAEVAVSPDYAKLVWTSYKNQLDQIVANPDWDTIALPDTCNKIDLLNDKLWSGVPYVKGAFFMRAVEQRVGRQALDQALALFYMWHVGQAARMTDLIQTIEWMTGTQLDDLTQVWLKQLGAPAVTL